MKVAELLARRRETWQELDRLCDKMQRRKARTDPATVSRFAALYRAACADLALADAYQLPPDTVLHLHHLVGRAHNQLYRSQQFNVKNWTHMLVYEAPRRIFNDRCVQFMFCLFWGVFILSAFLAYSKGSWPGYAEEVLNESTILTLENHFNEPLGGRDPEVNFQMAGYYIFHNTGIGLKCFAGGLLIIPGLFITTFNAAFLGASFGYMGRPDVEQGRHFFEFVRAHGPFELTAIVLSAGAGLRLGFGWMRTDGLTRRASLQVTAKQTMPVMGAAMVLFFLAAMLEAFLSPSAAPQWVKTSAALISCGILTFYFVVLGMAAERPLSERPGSESAAEAPKSPAVSRPKAAPATGPSPNSAN